MLPNWTWTVTGAFACVLAVPAVASAQAPGWHVDTEVAASRMAGGAREPGGDQVLLRPHRPLLVGVRLQRVHERIGYGIAVRYARPGLAFDGPEVSIVDRENTFKLIEIAPEVSLRIIGEASGPGLRARVGPVVDVWRWTAGETQTRLGVRGGLGLDLPVGRRIAVTIGGAATISGSMFEESEIEPDFEPKSSIRTEVGLGLRYALR